MEKVILKEKMEGKVVSVNISKKKGEIKIPVEEAILKEGYGIEGDVHAGLNEKKQVSILSWDRMKEENFCLKKGGIELSPGIYAENLTVEGIDLRNLKVGTRLKINDVILEVSQIGKKCHLHCEIYKKIGRCLMPEEGIFARVIRGGKIKVGDKIEIIRNG